MTRVFKAFVGFVVGLAACMAGGVLLGLGLAVGWALIAAGAVLGALFLLFYDVDEPKPEVRR